MSGLAVSALRTNRSPRKCGAVSRASAVSAEPITPPAIAGAQRFRTDFPSVVTLFLALVVLELGLGDHGDILRPKIVRRSGAKPGHRRPRRAQRLLGLALKVILLGRGERGAGLIALAVIDRADDIPGERVVVV